MRINSKGNFFFVIFLVVIVGLVAGACGEILSRSYITNNSALPYLSPEVNLTDLNSNSAANLVIRDPKKVVINQDAKITETIGSLSPSLVGIFKELNVKAGSDPLKSDYYSLQNPLFVGLVITSDGWVMAPLPSDLKDAFAAKGYVVVAGDKKIYQIDQISALKNFPGDVIFFHLAGASNLPVRKIVPRSDLALGQSLIVIDRKNNVWPTTLSSFKKTPEVLSSDTLNARLSLASNSDAVQKNSFVFDLSGNLTAVIGSDKSIVPAFAYSYYWQSFGKAEKALRPFLGLEYLDLSSVRIPGLNMEKGALIYADNGKTAVAKDSPAASAGLVTGDIISWVDNQEINSANDLADLIATYKPGDKVTLTYIRAGQERQAEIKLGGLK